MIRRQSKVWGLLPAAVCIGLVACQATVPVEPAPQWVGSWASAQQIPEPRNALAPEDLQDATLRQVVRTSLGGRRLRLRVSNVYGTAPLALSGVSIATSADPASSAIEPGTSKAVTFSGSQSVAIPAGAYMLSDPVEREVSALEHLTVSLHFPVPPAQQTGHPGSRATSYVLAGNHLVRERLPGAKEVDHWYQLSGLDVLASGPSRALLIIGDSITDGFGVQPNTDRRWTDFLIARIRKDPDLRDSLAVLNVGLGGNRLLLDGLGPNGLARFDRDVLNRPGAKHVIVLLGVNDLGSLSRDETALPRDYERLVGEMIAAYEQMIARAHANELQIVGATIMPFAGSSFYRLSAMAEKARLEINEWIRAPGHFDAVIDFDAKMRSSDDPARLDPAFDSGDHLHPSIAGYRAMAEFVPLELFKDPSM